MSYLLLILQLAMTALWGAALWYGGFLLLVLPWVGIPSVLVLFAACLATELTLFGLRLACDDGPGDAIRRRACFVFYGASGIHVG